MRILTTLTLLAIALCISAQTIDAEKAKQNAEAFLISNLNIQGAKSDAMASNNLTLVYTSKTDEVVCFYAFNNSNGGFVIASGDEVAEPILAYCEQGSFDLDKAPDNFKWWLHQYERQIAFAKANSSKIHKLASYDAHASASRQSVDVLCQTQWDQESPFYNQCPKSKSKYCLTGCVATAMAQVMKYWEWPVTGTGSHTYTDTYYSGKTITRTFSDHTYDWENMLTKYSSTASSVQKEAVATLMADCGGAVEMQYDPEGSGAWTENLSYCFVNYFGYDKGVKHLYRDYFTDSEWDSICYNELINKRPIMYGGSAEGGGHSFLCDGYNATNNTYHFNWGWSGEYDGYCKLSAVKPYSAMDFSYYQDIIVGVQPAKSGSVTPINVIASYGNIAYTEKSSGDYTTYTVNFGKTDGYDNYIYTDSYIDFDALFTIMYENKSTGERIFADVKDMSANKYAFKNIYPLQADEEGYATLDGYTSITINDVKVPNLKAGTWRVKVVYKNYTDKDKKELSLWNELRTYTDCKNYKEIVIENTIAAPEVLDATDISSTGFTANWKSIANATSYTLELTEKEQGSTEPQTLMAETFSKCTYSDKTKDTDIGSSLDTYLDNKGWSGKKIFSDSKRVKVGSSKAGWSLVSPVMTVEGPSDVTISVEETKYDEKTYDIIVEDSKGNTIASKTVSVSSSIDTMLVKGVSGDFTVTLTSVSSKSRVYISNISIVAGGGVKRTLKEYTNINDTSYVVTGLSVDKDYSYRVKGITPEGDSQWSASKIVVKSAVLLGDANNDGTVDVADITAIASHILGKTPEQWNATNADANQDKTIDVADITATADVILKQ